ncbi:ParB/RepB/Spo0J family partition protein [Bradyrhizobium barranii subsp. barranii]|uniref:ParB N-terminal domain-containing protein n=1 Tax=Bradyrhizobium barranii subsp. barranii TaxID=2823807 RepID=A0A7Z0QCQ1_9BRAD|nr:ParB/RepB/Spo0J family partition protein [Bradyrhizobium barranii]UGX92902.1 ParB/RepB/Spo0J family partition protein [Bradyrhizobium barranii subsp. barranii]
MKSRPLQPSISNSRGPVPVIATGLSSPQLGTSPSSIESKIQRIALSRLVVGVGHRPIDTDHVETIKESIERIGLTTPVFVVIEATGVATLIAGQHRVEAMRRLERTHIDAIVLDSNESRNRLLTISENLHRLGYCALERAEAENEWLQASQEEAGQVAQPSGGHQPNDRGISKTSRKLEVPRRQLQRAQKIASIFPEGKLRARELKLHDNQAALLKIAEGKTADEQLKIAADVVERRKQKARLPASEASPLPSRVGEQSPLRQHSPAPRVLAPSDHNGIPDFLKRGDPEEHFNRLVVAWNASPALQAAWADGVPTARSRFATEVLRMVPSENAEAAHVD